MSKLRVIVALTMALVAVMAMSGAAMAKGVKAPVIKPTVTKKFALLAPTPAGDLIGAEGDAKVVKTAAGLQDFMVDIEAVDPATETPILPAGTTFTVKVNGGVLAGTAVLDAAGGAVLELSNDPVHLTEGASAIPAGFPDVLTIKTIQVYDAAGNLVLSGSF